MILRFVKAMSLSRLRLRLAGAFALAFATGLTVLVAIALGYLWRESVRRLDARLVSVANGVGHSLEHEILETPDSALAFAAEETVEERPSNDDSFVIVNERGVVVAAADRAKSIDSVMAAFGRTPNRGRFEFVANDQDFRAIATPISTLARDGRTWRYAVIAYHSTEGIEHDVEVLLGVLALVAPLIIILSLGGGYILARRALTPMNELRTAIAGVVPANLEHRLAVPESPDEIGALAAEFNALFTRLGDAQRQNRRFVREAAHQIRTPLTLVLGEAGNELGTETPSVDRLRAALVRIRTAGEQMKHRVDELFLLAEAQAGEEVKLGDDVELDGLVLECTDLMRGRAFALGRALAIGQAAPVLIRGNAALLREALLELIENGCKHGEAATPITVSDDIDGNVAVISVESTGPAFTLATSGDTSSGVGLSIVQWIARGHHGELSVTSDNGRNVASIRIPLQAPRTRRHPNMSNT